MYNQQGTQGIPGTLTSVPPLMVSKTEPEEQLAQFSKKRPLDDPQSPEDQDVDKLTDDEKAAKKQRRLLKNREAAAQFRHRQKAYMQKLEKHAEDLHTSNSQVQAKIELLASENKLMKEQLGYLRNFMKNAVSLSIPTPPSLPPDSLVEASPDLTKVAPIPELFPPLLDIDDNANPNQNSTVVPSVDSGNSVVPNPVIATPDPSITLITTAGPANPLSASALNPLSVSALFNPLSASALFNPLSASALNPPLTNSTLLNNIFNSILAPDMDPAVIVKTE